MKVVLASDHRGFTLKEELKGYLEEQGHTVEDKGNTVYDKDDDFPDFAYPAALEVAADPEKTKGVLLCGSGVGMDIVANKVKGVRATLAYSKESAQHARAHDDVNVISIAGDVLSFPEAKEIVDTFLATPFEGKERLVRRLKKVSDIEATHFK